MNQSNSVICVYIPAYNAAQNPKIELFSFPENRDYGATVSAGIELCKSIDPDFCVCLDADGQYPPSYRGQACITCNMDHDAENAIPMFLCVACSRKMMILKQSRQSIGLDEVCPETSADSATARKERSSFENSSSVTLMLRSII